MSVNNKVDRLNNQCIICLAKTARPSQILACRPRLCNNDLSLVNWLEAMDKSQYVLPFKQKSLDLKLEKIR